MSSRSEFEEFARDCVRLAGQANSPELRQKLFDIAREWMRAAMDWEDARKTTPRSRGYEASEKVKSSEYAPGHLKRNNSQSGSRFTPSHRTRTITTEPGPSLLARACGKSRSRPESKSRLALRVSARTTSVYANVMRRYRTVSAEQSLNLL